jgi:GTPase SAR1 family protein
MGEPYKWTSEDTVIAVMGPTGAGKTSFVRTQVGHSLKSGKSQLTILRKQNLISTSNTRDQRPPCPGRQTKVVLLDTPGFDDTFRSDADVLRVIADWLASSYVGGH